MSSSSWQNKRCSKGHVMIHHQRPAISLFTLLLFLCTTVTALKFCSLDADDGDGDNNNGIIISNGGTCPDGNTCCPTSQPGVSSCITNNVGSNDVGVCCTDDSSDDDDAEVVPTGCAPGFRCSSSMNNSKDDGFGGGSNNNNNSREKEHYYYCKKDNGEESNEAEAAEMIVPRYRLCTLTEEQLGVVHGLPIQIDSSSSSTTTTTTSLRQTFPLENDSSTKTKESTVANLAYFSTMGSITSPTTTKTQLSSAHKSIRLIIIVVHGSGRNADDYLCSASVTSYIQNNNNKHNNKHQYYYDPKSILVLAPWFLAPTDSTNTTKSFPSNALTWDDIGTPTTIPHAFRYGALDSYYGKISSYQAMDELVEALVGVGGGMDDDSRFPSLERIVVAGHSAGGQFVQRWALTSRSVAWGDNDDDDDDKKEEEDTYNDKKQTYKKTKKNKNKKKTDKQAVHLRAIVANPRSFAYLDARRFLKKTFQIPPRDMMYSCPGYDEWEWGLEPGGPLVVPYVSDSLSSSGGGYGGAEEMISRYMARDVIYLAGILDNTTVTASCEDDEFQGRSRLERSANFYDALQIIYEEKKKMGEVKKKKHRRMVVDGVGHDHALMFQSEQGLEAIFGESSASSSSFFLKEEVVVGKEDEVKKELF